MILLSTVPNFCSFISAKQIVDEHTGAIIGDGLGGSSVVLLMVRDAYANYVVQTTLDVISECEEKALLLKELNSHAIELVSSASAHTSTLPD